MPQGALVSFLLGSVPIAAGADKSAVHPNRTLCRETSNRIRFVIEELLPPLLRDSSLFRRLAQHVWGEHILDLAQFRAHAPFLSEPEYEALYRAHPRIHAETDNSIACVDRVVSDTIGTSVCDVGCGTGYLLAKVLDGHPEITRATGVDFVINDPVSRPGITYMEAKIETLPFEDGEFDTVICTHVIEHILDYRGAIAELRRIARKRLIVVVPREREAIYSFNPHFNFFPYVHSILRAMIPVPTDHVCVDIGRDIYYCEERR
jgi:SAM-dependent methyltransferase